MRRFQRFLPVLLLPLLAGGAFAQAPESAAGGWNSERSLALIQRAQLRRAESNADTGLVNYRADARLFVYFYLDRPDTGERNLVKTDQLALDVLWQSPDLVKQRIIGWRDEKSLPTRINYHLDHLTVVQENFGDEIRLGDGDEVRGVPHPAAPAGTMVYDYRLADSLTLRLPGAGEPVRVYELQVRPREPGRPGFLGSVFVEQRQGDLVRMDFTFTAASYVDRYLDYINISLDNGLWGGRFWLPNQQRVEIRRRIPELDVPAGSVIRANMRVGNYRFNEELPPGTFAGPPVVAVPPAQREAFPFEEEIHAQVREEGIGPELELGEIRRLAAELVERRALSRVQGIRLRLPGASNVFRYNRAEGVVLGAGASLVPRPGLRATAAAGWAFGAAHPVLSLSLEGVGEVTRVRGSLYTGEARDVGLGPVVSGAVNTLSSLVAGRDYRDLYHATGASLEMERRLSSTWTVEISGRAEEHTSARLRSEFSAFGDLRPVRPVDDSELFRAVSAAARRTATSERSEWWGGSVRLHAGALQPRRADDSGSEATMVAAGLPGAEFLKSEATYEWGRRWVPRDAELRISASGGAAVGELPRQELYLLGGRGTLPGYAFRGFGGDRYALAEGVVSAELLTPWLRGRALGALGWTGSGSAGDAALGRWGGRTTGTVLPSVGVGIGVFYDIIRLDVARGLGRGGGWEVIVEANRGFWDFL